MSFLRISVFFSIFTLFLLVNDAHASRHYDFPGVVELVGYNNRKSRMGQEFSHGVSFVTPPMKKTRADIERVKQNIEEYNKLLKMDTKKLSEQQKDMLERIVERVARLKESLDIEVETTTETIAREEISNITETVTTFLPTTEFVTLPTTMLDAVTTIKRDQSEARSNTNNSNNLNAKNNTGNHGKGKAKVRTNTSRRPASPTKPTTKRTTGPRPSIKPTVAAIAITSSTSPGVYNGQKVTTITTIQPQMKQHQKQQQQQDVGHDVLMKQQNHQEEDVVEQKTLPSITDHRQPNVQQRNPLGGAGVSADLIYDSNVTTSTIIDSLANHAREDYYNRDSLSESTNKEKQKPSGTAKPTKYHYYPHNQHIYLLPECAIQQVCNAVYVRLNYTQPLCACPSRYRDPCSASLNEDDLHTTKLVGDGKKKAITLAKTCETTTEMRECRSPKDWSLLALQNTRTGKSHYLVICRCPDHYKLEGPMAHDQPTYASVPGIRVFGMMCVKPGYSVRRPSVQPPKRYQLQKPYYIPNTNKYSANKDRPLSYQQESYQNQHQANYQYLNRPESAPIINSYTEFPESVNSFGGIYGRNNEKKGDTIAAEEGSGDTNENKREKRSIDDLDDEVPEFPVHRLEKFQQSVVWD